MLRSVSTTNSKVNKLDKCNEEAKANFDFFSTLKLGNRELKNGMGFSKYFLFGKTFHLTQ